MTVGGWVLESGGFFSSVGQAITTRAVGPIPLSTRSCAGRQPTGKYGQPQRREGTDYTSQAWERVCPGAQRHREVRPRNHPEACSWGCAEAESPTEARHPLTRDPQRRGSGGHFHLRAGLMLVELFPTLTRGGGWVGAALEAQLLASTRLYNFQRRYRQEVLDQGHQRDPSKSCWPTSSDSSEKSVLTPSSTWADREARAQHPSSRTSKGHRALTTFW